MKKIRLVLIPLVLMALFFVWLFPQLPGLWWAEHYGYVRYTPQLISDQSLDKKEFQKLLQSIRQAEFKIKDFWGSRRGRGHIVYCRSQETFNKLCSSGEGTGCSIGTPFGSWIILSQSGLNENVVAHEMCHVELMARIGWWPAKKDIPTWLDEGLALQLDDRFVTGKDSIQRYIDYKSELEMYTGGNQQAVALENLENNKQFFGGTASETKVAYLTAATEVSKLLTRISRKEFLDKLQKNPADFKRQK